MSRQYRFFPIAIALVSVVAASSCSDDSRSGSSAEPAAITQPSATQTDGTIPQPSSPAAEPATPSTVAPPAESGPVDGGADRVVAGNQLLLDAALALELPVIAVAAPTDRDGIPPYLAEAAADVAVVPATPEPNYEQLLGLRPDLIVVPEEADDAGIVDVLAGIAPTETVPGNTATPWSDVLRQLAGVTGRDDRASELIERWDARVVEFRETVGDELDLEVSLVRCFRDSCRYLPGATSFAGFVLDELGVSRPAVQQVDPEGRPFVEVSLEQIDLLDGDVIVVFGSDADEAIAALEASPLWAGLRGVRSGRVHRADPYAWFQGNVIAANVIADDLEQWLTES